jgi:Holliday junction resolvase-like predicted endonuclease
MTVERTILVSLLKLTREGPVSKSLVSKDAHVPVQVADEMLEKITREGLVQLRSNVVETSSNQRVKIAVRAIRLGADFEKACRALRWDEFENITATAFSANNFTITKSFRFKHAGRRWEIDVIGCKEPIVACVDCKHRRHGWTKSASIKAAEAQIERTEALARVLPKHQRLELNNWRKAILIPVILSLVRAPLKFHEKTPIVPILQLQSFLTELPAQVNTLKHFLVRL